MSSEGIAGTPEPPYYAVVFTSIRTKDHHSDYDDTAAAMVRLAVEQSGFLGVESARDEIGITVSYWRDLDSICAWKRHADHVMAQRDGRARFYEHYTTRIAKVERDYSFSR